MRGTALLLAALVTSGAAAAPAAEPAALEALVGMRLVVGLNGTAPTPALLERIRQGTGGRCDPHGPQHPLGAAGACADGSLRAAARAGGRRILIVADQEGGQVRRFRWAPPVASAEELGRLGEAALRSRGRDTARALDRLGVDVDLAPVADVPTVDGLLHRRPEARVLSDPESRREGGHGLLARASGRRHRTDAQALSRARAYEPVDRPRRGDDRRRCAVLDRGLVPYRRAIAANVVQLVMVSNASYTAYGGLPAAWSPRVLRLLDELGYAGVTITDALDALATTQGEPLDEAASAPPVQESTSCSSSAPRPRRYRVYDRLLAEARAGRLTRAALEQSAARIEELKATYAG